MLLEMNILNFSAGNALIHAGDPQICGKSPDDKGILHLVIPHARH
jgi:hypothetical protein